MEQHTHNGWSGGDRVYLVALPGLTGTVIGNVTAGAVVNWDIYAERDMACVYGACELDCYTLPRSE